MNRSLAPRVLLALLLLVPALPAAASVVRPVSVEALARASDAVVKGEVVARRSVLASGGRRILTIVTVAVDDAYKGGVEETTEVVVPGGEVGDLAQTVVGLPRLESGDRVVLFLDRRPGGAEKRPTFELRALGQSVYRLKGDRALRQVEGLEVVTGPLDRQARAAAPDVDLPLAELERRIRAAIEVAP